MRTSLWFLMFVIFYFHDKCVKSRDIPNGFQTTFKTVADFIKGFVAKSSSSTRGKDQKKLGHAHKKFKHHAWEDSEAKYVNKSEKHNSTAAYQLTVSEVAQWHGFNIETHIVKTTDGYFLTTHRIAGVNNLRNRTVLLHHGLLGSAMDWILLQPGECMLPFTLAEAGYDVWFMNARGNIYSRSHATLTLSMPEFWDFSFEEMGRKDIPAVIDYIRKQNDVPIDFVAHSMGSTAFLVYLSSLSEYKKYLRTGVLIAPLAFMRNVTGPLRSVPEDIFKPRRGEFMPHRKVSRELASTHCKGPIRLCRNPLFFLTGVPTQTSFTTRVKDHVPAGGSVKTILHYMHLVKSGMFHSYKNKTDIYDMHSIDVPLALISSNNDELAIVKNVQRIYGLIKYPIAHYIIRNKNVSHTDLLWDKTASCVVFRKTLEYLVKGHKKFKKTHENVEESKNEDKIPSKVKVDQKVKYYFSKKDEDEGGDKFDIFDIKIDDNNNEVDKNDDKNDNYAKYKNDDKNDEGANDDDTAIIDHDEDKDTDGGDNNDDEGVEDDEDEVSGYAKDKESNENKILFNDKGVVKNEHKGRIKLNIVKGETEGTNLGESENKDKTYKFIIEVKGEDIIVRKIEDKQDKIEDNQNNVEDKQDKIENNQDKIEEKAEIKSNYTGINNETSGGKGEDEILSTVLNQDTSTNSDKGQGKNEHKCVNPIGKNNVACIDDIIDDGHIFYDGPEAYMDFQVT